MHNTAKQLQNILCSNKVQTYVNFWNFVLPQTFEHSLFLFVKNVILLWFSTLRPRSSFCVGLIKKLNNISVMYSTNPNHMQNFRKIWDKKLWPKLGPTAFLTPSPKIPLGHSFLHQEYLRVALKLPIEPP